MAAGQPSSRNPFDGLPDDTLGTIAGQLGLTDRVRFLSCCQATRRYQLSCCRATRRQLSKVLFPVLDFKLESAGLVEQLLMWLVRVKQQVGSLSLGWDGGNEEVSAASLLLLGALADSSLHKLDVGVTGRVRLGGWLIALRCLRSLCRLDILADQMEVVVGLSSLTSLTGLVLESRGRHIVIPPGALPPALEVLGVKRFDAASLGEALLAAGPLRQLKTLSLTLPNEPLWLEAHWDALAAHTQLTALALGGWSLRGVPRQLRALTALQTFSLYGADLGGNEVSLEALTSLTQLSRLLLPQSGLGSVPASVLALPALQELDLRINILNAPVPIASSHNLTRLFIEASSAVEACERLTALSALRTLVLTARPAETRVKHGDAGRLIHSLSKLPNFAELDARQVGCNPNPFSVVKEVLLPWKVLPFTIIAEQ